jgi:hypothetical protein
VVVTRLLLPTLAALLATLALPLLATLALPLLAILVDPRLATRVRLPLDTRPPLDTQVLRQQGTRPHQGCLPATQVLATHLRPLVIPLLVTLPRDILAPRDIPLQATQVRHTQARQATHLLLCHMVIQPLLATLVDLRLVTRACRMVAW